MKSKLAALTLALLLVACGGGTLNTVRTIWEAAKTVTDCLLGSEYTDKETAFVACGVTSENLALAESTWTKAQARDEKKFSAGKIEGSKVGACAKK